MDKKLLSTSEVAKVLGVSRIAIFKKIKSGQIKAKKIGRNFAIEREELGGVLGKILHEPQKKEIEKAVSKAAKEYGRALRLLGRE